MCRVTYLGHPFHRRLPFDRQYRVVLGYQMHRVDLLDLHRLLVRVHRHHLFFLVLLEYRLDLVYRMDRVYLKNIGQSAMDRSDRQLTNTGWTRWTSTTRWTGWTSGTGATLWTGKTLWTGWTWWTIWTGTSGWPLQKVTFFI